MLIQRAVTPLVCGILALAYVTDSFADERSSQNQTVRMEITATAEEFSEIMSLYGIDTATEELMDGGARIRYVNGVPEGFYVDFFPVPKLKFNKLCVTEFYSGMGLIDGNDYKLVGGRHADQYLVSLPKSADECHDRRLENFYGFVPIPKSMALAHALQVLENVDTLSDGSRDYLQEPTGNRKQSYRIVNIKKAQNFDPDADYCATLEAIDHDARYRVCFSMADESVSVNSALRLSNEW